MTERGTAITSVDELEQILGVATGPAARKVRHELQDAHRTWLAAASLGFIATTDAAGNVDVSPKGDPAGFVRVLDEHSIAIPERPGNRRTDGFHNILQNPHVGLVFIIPGRGDTLRINGRATIVRDAPFLSEMVVRGHEPLVALVIDIDEVFFHCSKAFLRSKTWEPDQWHPDAAPRRAVIAQQLERSDESLEELDAYYGPAYDAKIYG